MRSISAAASARGSPWNPVPKSASTIDVVPVRVVRLVGDVPGLAQHARGDTSVAAVRPATADAREAARGRKRAHRLLRHRGPGPLHELRDGLGVVRVALLAARVSAAE